MTKKGGTSGWTRNKGRDCGEKGCGRPAKVRGRCYRHHNNWYRRRKQRAADALDLRGALERLEKAFAYAEISGTYVVLACTLAGTMGESWYVKLLGARGARELARQLEEAAASLSATASP